MIEHAPEAQDVPHGLMGTPVTEFLSAAQNNDPLLYPGERPETSYITDGDQVYTLRTEAGQGKLEWMMCGTDDEAMSANDFLAAYGAAPMEERIPVLAFGANASPGSLAKKFAKVERSDALVVPTALATLKGHDIVWSGGPGVNGNFIAMLHNGPETAETEVEVGINFLTREQLLVMHGTELAYDLSSLDVDIAGTSVRAFFYDGQDRVYTENGKPVAIKNVTVTGRTLSEASTADLLGQVLEIPEVMAAVTAEHPELKGADARTYVAYVSRLLQTRGKGAKLALKRLVHDRLAHTGHSVQQKEEGVLSRRESWANPSTLPTLSDQQQGTWHHDVYRLPSQEMVAGSWADEAARNKVLGAVSTHYIRMRPELQPGHNQSSKG